MVRINLVNSMCDLGCFSCYFGKCSCMFAEAAQDSCTTTDGLFLLFPIFPYSDRLAGLDCCRLTRAFFRMGWMRRRVALEHPR